MPKSQPGIIVQCLLNENIPRTLSKFMPWFPHLKLRCSDLNEIIIKNAFKVEGREVAQWLRSHSALSEDTAIYLRQLSTICSLSPWRGCFWPPETTSLT